MHPRRYATSTTRSRTRWGRRTRQTSSCCAGFTIKRVEDAQGMHAAVYLRQSLDRTGEGQAVARQRKDCLALSKRRKWTPIEYVDNDRSATNGKVRPAYQRMLADIRDGKVGALVAWDLDRLYSQPRELEDLIDLADEHRLALAT